MDWTEWAEPIAYGPLDLKPWEFERLQPLEFTQLWDGYRWRQDQEDGRTAYFTASAMSVHTKKPVSPQELLNPLKEPKKRNKKQDEQYLKNLFKDTLNGGG